MYNLSLPIYVLLYRCIWTDYTERVLLTVSSRYLLCYYLSLRCSVLYCTMLFIATCVDAIGMVFWDRPLMEVEEMEVMEVT